MSLTKGMTLAERVAFFMGRLEQFQKMGCFDGLGYIPRDDLRALPGLLREVHEQLRPKHCGQVDLPDGQATNKTDKTGYPY